jgi:superfamily II DNA or RNA helicase
MDMMDVFSLLKKNKNGPAVISHGGSPEELYFALNFDDDFCAYINVVNKKGEVVVNFDYTLYPGVLRTILKNISLLQSKADFTINWNNPDNNIYLHEHPYLLPQLLNSNRLLNKAGQKIEVDHTTSEPLPLFVTINTAEDNKLYAKPVIYFEAEENTDFLFLNDTYVLFRDKRIIAETQNIGPHFNLINSFYAKFLVGELQKFLSLLFSSLNKVHVNYKEYTIVYDPENISSVPALIFEKVDAENFLYLRIGETLPNTPVDFLENYDISRLAQVNDMEQVIHVKSIEQCRIEDCMEEIEKALKKHVHKKDKKTGGNEVVQDGNLFIVSSEVAGNFVYKEMPFFLGKYIIVGSEKLKEYKINAHPPKLNLQLSHGIDFLEGDASLQFGAEQVPLFAAISQYSKNKYILLGDGSHAIVNDTYMQKLQRLFKKKNEKVRLSFFDLPLAEELLEEKMASQQLKLSREIFEGFNELDSRKLKFPVTTAILRPYQQYGYKWLHYLHEKKLGGCLADDMGLGKTLQAITLLAGLYGKKKLPPSLVVMPKSLLFNWEAEMRKFAPKLRFYTYYEQNRDWKVALTKEVIFTTYALLRNDIEQFKEKKFYYVILDESQNIKNANAQVSKAVLLLQCSHRLALSGTPVENNLTELYSLFRFLNPSMFESAEHFNQYYLTPVQKYNDPDAMQDLRKKIYPFILRRLKKDVLTELPDKIEQTLYVEMSPEQASFYEQRRLYYKDAIARQVAMKGIRNSQLFVLQALNELRQIASVPEAKSDGNIDSPKVDMLMELVADAVANKHKILVFANYLSAVELIGEKLDTQGIDYVTMTGSTRDRKTLVDRFQSDSDCKVFLMTLKTGGTGLNLTAADVVFIFDPWWNKAAENQAIDRAHRIGQNKSVTCYKLIAKGTIEEKIVQLQEVKAELFNNIIAGDSASLKSFSEEDINYIMGNGTP